MLTQIELRYFKCFELLKLPLAPLTLLAGANASGKSTVLQALGLLHQSVKVSFRSNRLLLNGPVLRLGRTVDVIDQVHGRRSCSITLLDSVAEESGVRPDLQNAPEEAQAILYAWDFEGEPADRSLKLTSVRFEDEIASQTLGREELIPNEMTGGSLPLSAGGLELPNGRALGTARLLSAQGLRGGLGHRPRR